MFRLGVIINPWAGLGGSVALKGSDGESIRSQALALGANPQASNRMARALAPLQPLSSQIQVFGYAGDMGEKPVASLGFDYQVVGRAAGALSTPEDTLAAASALERQGIDLLLFAGGDGTARLVADAVGLWVPVLGVPAGVKMHSGVFAITPEAAGAILEHLLTRHWVDLVERDVRDIDEAALRESRVRARYYASLRVPELPQWLQGVKNAGAPVDELAQRDLAAGLAETLEDDCLYIIGPGSTTYMLLEELGLEGSLLGVDLVYRGELIGRDMTADQLLKAVMGHEGDCRLIITAIGGQGHVLGRGNQQLSPALLRHLGRQRIQVIATREKLRALHGRPLLLDTNDAGLDHQLSGYWPVICGYRETLLYPVGLLLEAH